MIAMSWTISLFFRKSSAHTRPAIMLAMVVAASVADAEQGGVLSRQACWLGAGNWSVSSQPVDATELIRLVNPVTTDDERAAAERYVKAMLAARKEKMSASRPAPSTHPATAPAGGVPKFRCEEPVYSFPEVWSGEAVEHNWVIHNDGDGVLEISSVQSTCGCTVAQYDKEIAPGGQGKVAAKLDTSGLREEVVKSLVVRTNDPKMPRTVFQLKGTVKARISMTPPEGVQFPQGTPTANLMQKVLLTNNTGQPMKLEVNPPGAPTAFNSTLKEVQPGKVFELAVGVDQSQLHEGYNATEIELKTGVPAEPVFHVPASLYVPPLLEATPGSLTIATPTKIPIHREIIIRYYGASPMKITGVSASDPAIKVQVEQMPVSPQAAGSPAGRAPATGPRAPTQLWKVTIDIAAGWDPGQTQAGGEPIQIKVATDAKERPEVRIPVNAIAQQAVGKLASRPAVPPRRLGFAVIPTLDQSGNVDKLSPGLVADLVSDVEAKGPQGGTKRLPDYDWFEAECELPPRSIMAVHNERVYVLLPTAGDRALMSLAGGEPLRLQGAQAGKDSLGHPVVDLALEPATAARFKEFSKGNLGKAIAIIFDGQVISQAVIRSEMGERVQISGNYTEQQVKEMVAKLAKAATDSTATQPATRSDR